MSEKCVSEQMILVSVLTSHEGRVFNLMTLNYVMAIERAVKLVCKCVSKCVKDFMP